MEKYTLTALQNVHCFADPIRTNGSQMCTHRVQEKDEDFAGEVKSTHTDTNADSRKRHPTRTASRGGLYDLLICMDQH